MIGALVLAADGYGSRHANEQEAAAVVAVIYSEGDDADEFLRGVKLAADAVNRAGGIDGLPLRLRLIEEAMYTEQSDLDTTVLDSLELATRISDDPAVLAVIGHSSSSTAIPASSVYERKKLLFLATHATATSLSNHGFDFVFSLQPNNADSASLMASYALANGLRRFVILSDDTRYGLEVTGRFASSVAQGGAEILYRGGVTSHGHSVDRQLMFLLDNAVFRPTEIDAIFISTSSEEEASRFISRARALNLRMPILAPGLLFARNVEELVGPKKMQGVAAVSSYDRDSQGKENLAFVDAFVRASGQQPDALSAIGYDAINLIAYAVKRVGGRDSAALADTLRLIRYESSYEGAAGAYAFDADGRVTDTDTYVVVHDGVDFRAVDSVLIHRRDERARH